MSMITDSLPESLLILGQEYAIKSDFKIWLRISELMSDGELTAQKAAMIFNLVFDKPPSDISAGLQAVFDFYTHDMQCEKKEKISTAKNCFDFDYDAELIYSAFMQQYNIDLCNADMHWWKFKSLLNGLSENTHFVQAIQYRTMDISQIKDKEMRKHYKKMKSLYKLPDKRSEEQKEQELSIGIESLF